MAYNRTASASQSNEREFEKAIGFLNLSIPYVREDGSVGLYHFPTGIPLRASKPEEKELAEYLKADAANAAKLLPTLQARYVAVAPAGVARGKLMLPA